MKYEGVSIVRRHPGGREEVITAPGEPWFLIRAQDTFAVEATRGYAALLRAAANIVTSLSDEGLRLHLEQGAQEIENIADRILRWQADNPTVVKVPD